MDESLGVIMQLLEGMEPVTCETDWFKLRDFAAKSLSEADPLCSRGVRSISRRRAFSGQAWSLCDLAERAPGRGKKHQLEGPMGDC